MRRARAREEPLLRDEPDDFARAFDFDADLAVDLGFARDPDFALPDPRFVAMRVPPSIRSYCSRIRGSPPARPTPATGGDRSGEPAGESARERTGRGHARGYQAEHISQSSPTPWHSVPLVKISHTFTPLAIGRKIWYSTSPWSVPFW